MNRTEYIGKLNALYVGDKNCLEELITAYDEKDEEIERLNNIIKRFEKDLREVYLTFGEFSEEYTEKKIRELKGSDKE